MREQSISSCVRQSEGTRDLLTVLDAQQRATHSIYRSPQHAFQSVGQGAGQCSDFDDGNLGRTPQCLSHAIGIRSNQSARPQLDTAVVTNHGGQYALQVLMAQYLEHGLPGDTTGLAIVDRRGMATGHQGPADVCSAWVLCAQAGNDGLGTGPVRHGLDTTKETALPDDQFALDSG